MYCQNEKYLLMTGVNSKNNATKPFTCLRCGNYCAGISRFDFSDMPGYCSYCRDEIKGEFDDDDYDSWQPCDDCDLPDACQDFGCAINSGIRQPKDW